MKKLALFGGSGGLGIQLYNYLVNKYDVISLSSKDLDIRIHDDVKLFFEQNKIDIVVNATGVNLDTFIHKIDNDKLEKIKHMVDVNLIGNINILSSCLPHMREQGYGRIILFSSILSEESVMGTSIYSACKSFIDSLARNASKENISKGVTCNSLRLGYFDGGMCHKMPPEFQKIVKDNIGLKRWGYVEEIYNTINYIVDTEFITGENLRINGG